MIEIVLSMFPVVLIGSMTTAGLEPREKSYEELVEHLDKLEVSLPEETITRKDKSNDASPKKISFKRDKKDKKDKRNIKVGKIAKGHHQKSCEIWKALKGSDNLTWKTHNTNACRSKYFYKGRVTSSNNQDKPEKKKH